MTSINGKLDALLQLANESNVNSARTAEIVPQVMGDTAAMDAQAAEMAATGGMPPMPPEGVPGGDVPPEAMGGAPPEEPMPEEAPVDVPPEGDVKNEPMPPVDEPAADMGPVPEEPVPDMGAMPQEEPAMGEEIPPEESAMGMGGGDMGLGEIDWSAYSIDNAYEDFEEALKDEAKEALDAGDTQRVAAITQVMDAIRMIWAQSGVADEAPVPEMAGQVAPGVDGMPAPDMMKSEGDDMTGMEDATKAELEPIKEETMVEEEVEKADDMGGDIAEGETAGGDAVEGVEASEGCEKSEGETEVTEVVEAAPEVEDAQKSFEETEDVPEEVEVPAPVRKSEGMPLPSFRSMMEAREQSGRPFDCSADEDMLRGARMGQVYKSENGTFMVINSSRPNVASALGMQAKIEPQDLHKSSAPKIDVNEDDPLRKSLRSDWENYMAYKETDSF